MKTNVNFSFEFSTKRNAWIAKSAELITVRHTDGTIVPARILIEVGSANLSQEEVETASTSREAIASVLSKGQYALSAAKRIGADLVNTPVDEAVAEYADNPEGIFFSAWPAQRVTRTVSMAVDIAEANAVTPVAMQRQVINLFAPAPKPERKKKDKATA